MGEIKHKILFVEDDSSLGFLTKSLLEAEGFFVELCADGEQGLQTFYNREFDLGLFDVMLPKIDGFELASKIRKVKPDFPFIFLTAKNQKSDKFTGFKVGGDDYLTKPFDEDELIWRINAVLNRSSNNLPESTGESELHIGDYLFKPKNQLLIYKTDELRLTERETKVLELLTLNKGNIIRREQLLEEIWGLNDYFAGRSLDVFIAKLRKYLKSDSKVIIENIPRVGFLLRD